MANKQISDLQARTFDGDSIIPHDVENTDPSTMSQKPYLTGSATGHAVADFVGNGEIYTTDLNTVDKHINGAINELHAINGYNYDAYDDTATYAVGDLCIYNNALYKCTTAITTAEAWNASHWTATSIADEISELNTGKQNNPTIITHSDRVQVGPNAESAICIKSLSAGTYGVVARANLENNESGKYFTMKLYTGSTLRNELLTVIGASVYPALTVSSFFTIDSTQNCTIKIQHNCTSASYSSGSLQIIKFV